MRQWGGRRWWVHVRGAVAVAGRSGGAVPSRRRRAPRRARGATRGRTATLQHAAPTPPTQSPSHSPPTVQPIACLLVNLGGAEHAVGGHLTGDGHRAGGLHHHRGPRVVVDGGVAGGGGGGRGRGGGGGACSGCMRGRRRCQAGWVRDRGGGGRINPARAGKYERCVTSRRPSISGACRMRALQALRRRQLASSSPRTHAPW